MTSWPGPSSRRSSKARGLRRTSCGVAVERGRLLLRPLPLRERAARKFQRRWLGERCCSETPLTHSLLRSAAAALSRTGRGHNNEVNMNPIRRLAIAAAALSFWCFALFGATTPANAQANSQDWPSRPVKFIVPLGPGSGTDIGARLVAEQLTRLWGQPVLVETGTGMTDVQFEAYFKREGLALTRVAYRDVVTPMTDLSEGRIQAYAAGLPILLPHVQAGRAKLVALTNSRRSPSHPDMPTVGEAGFPGLTFDGLVGIFGPRDLPAAARERIATSIRTVLAEPAFASRLIGIGAGVLPGDGAEFAASIDEQRAKLAGALGVKAR